jgi:hypothetical protein
MLGAIENMKFFLRTGFGDLATFSSSGISIKRKDCVKAIGQHRQDGRASASA